MDKRIIWRYTDVTVNNCKSVVLTQNRMSNSRVSRDLNLSDPASTHHQPYQTQQPFSETDAAVDERMDRV